MASFHRLWTKKINKTQWKKVLNERVRIQIWYFFLLRFCCVLWIIKMIFWAWCAGAIIFNRFVCLTNLYTCTKYKCLLIVVNSSCRCRVCCSSLSISLCVYLCAEFATINPNAIARSICLYSTLFHLQFILNLMNSLILASVLFFILIWMLFPSLLFSPMNFVILFDGEWLELFFFLFFFLFWCECTKNLHSLK